MTDDSDISNIKNSVERLTSNSVFINKAYLCRFDIELLGEYLGELFKARFQI